MRRRLRTLTLAVLVALAMALSGHAATPSLARMSLEEKIGQTADGVFGRDSRN